MRVETERQRDRLTAVRRVDAEPALVWEAFTTAEHVAAFWGGDHAVVPVDSVRVDARVGGDLELVTVAPDGARRPLRFTYDEVEEPTRLVFTEPVTGIVTRVDLRAEGSQTVVSVHQRRLPPELQTRQAEAGLAAILDRLGELVADLS